MEIQELKKHIMKNTIPPFMIFIGDEWKVQEEYIKQISKVTKKNIQYIDSIADVYSKLKNTSFIKTSNIYIARDDKTLIESEKLQKQIQDGLLGDNIYILKLTNPDKRTKFYKTFSDTMIEFAPLTDMSLKKYILKEISLSDKNCEKLIDICEKDYGRILLEIDKIKRYVDATL